MILLAHKYGQLGNRLEYLKAYIALALEYDMKVVIFSFDEYAGFFTGTSRGMLCTFPAQKGLPIGNRLVSRCIHSLLNSFGQLVKMSRLPHANIIAHPDENECHVFVGERIESLKKSKLVLFLSGWPCIPIEIIEKHSEEIRKYFSLVNKHALRVRDFIDFARTHGDFLVGIHIRQGDYKEWNGGTYYFETDIYVRLMRKISEKHKNKNITFVICSNEDQNWSLFKEFTFFAGPGDAVCDMYSLAECDEIYGPQSSFSAWASFYGRVPFYGVHAFD